MNQEQQRRVDDLVRQAVAPDPAAVTRLTSPGARRVMFEEAVGSARGGNADVVRRPQAKRRYVLVATAAAVLVAVGGVWAVTAGEAAHPPTAAQPTATGVDLDRYTAANQLFYQPIRASASVAMSRPPDTLEAAFSAATATVVAEVSAVNPGRILPAPALGDLQFIDVELRVHEVLRGALRPELNGVVRVELGTGIPPASIGPELASMRSHLPTDPAIWLIRWQGEPSPTRKPGAPSVDHLADLTRYRTVHATCGVFVQGADHVIAATAPADYPAGPAQREGEQFALLSELANRARQ